MSGMRTVVVDKIASVTQACGLSHELRVAAEEQAKITRLRLDKLVTP